MNQTTILARQKAVAAAIGSVKAEGLTPSKRTRERLQSYAKGTATIGQVRRAVLQDIAGTAQIAKT